MSASGDNTGLQEDRGRLNSLIQPTPLSRSDKFALATNLFLLTLSAVMQVCKGADGDKGWLLLAAKTWIGGKRLYVDIFEVNPPLILWLYAIPAWISLHVRWLANYAALGMMGLAFSALSVGLCLKLIRRHPAYAGNARRQTEAVIFLAALFIFLTPQSAFFDREHILLVFTFPYVLRFMPSLAGKPLPLRLRVAIGVFSAPGFCIKPHALILLAAVQLLYILREKSWAILWSVENGIIYVAIIFYLWCVMTFAPEYVHVVLPMALETYSSYGVTGSSLLYLPSILLCACLTFSEFRLRYTSPWRRDIYYFIGICLVFLVHSMISNGWDYTYYPLMSMLLFLSGVVLSEFAWLKREHEAQGLPAKPFLFGMRGCSLSLGTQGVYMALITFFSMSALAINTRCERNPECLEKNPYVERLHQYNAHSFGTISLNYAQWVDLVRLTGARWDTRFNHLWMLPKVAEKGEKSVAEHQWIFNYMADAYAQDLGRGRTELMFVARGHQFFAEGNPIDLTQFLSGNAAFRTAWSKYRYDSTIDACNKNGATIITECRYDVYVRTP